MNLCITVLLIKSIEIENSITAQNLHEVHGYNIIPINLNENLFITKRKKKPTTSCIGICILAQWFFFFNKTASPLQFFVLLFFLCVLMSTDSLFTTTKE